MLRRADGSLELGDPTRSTDASERSWDGNSESPRARAPLAVQIHDATIELMDEYTKTRILLENVEGDGSCEDKLNSVHNLCGTVNGGLFRFAGHVDRTPPTTRFQGRFIADDVTLDDGMTGLLRYVVPVLAGSSLHLKGKMHTDLLLHGNGTNLAALSHSLQGQGEIAINPIDLDGAPVMNELTRIAEFSGGGHVASVRSDFVIRDQRITTDHFTLDIGRVPITMAGWTDLDGRIDYRIKLDGLTQRIPDKARRILGELNIDVQGLCMLTLNGTTDQIVVKLNGIALDRNSLKDSGLHRDDREKLKVLGRQFLDKLIR